MLGGSGLDWEGWSEHFHKVLGRSTPVEMCDHSGKGYPHVPRYGGGLKSDM